MKHEKPYAVIAREFNSETEGDILAIQELDDSFLAYSDSENLYFCELNLGKVLQKIPSPGTVDLQSLGRVLILAKHYDGI